MGNPTPASRGSTGAAILPFLQTGPVDPTLVAVAGEVGSLYLQIPMFNTDPPGSHGLFEKTVDSGFNTSWQRVGSGSSPTPSEIDYKDPVDTVNAIGANVNLAAPGGTINGVVMAAGMSFLVTEQTSPSENGIYDWNGAATPATRRADCVAPYVTKGMFTWVNTGPTQRALTGWILTTANPIVVGTTALSFTQIPVNTSQSTRIANIYWVAQNGNDASPSTRGSIAAPFASVQAAINQAVVEHPTGPCYIYVMPQGGTYAGFTTARGVSVMGIHKNLFKTRVNFVNIVPDATGINNNTGDTICNLSIGTVGTAQSPLTWTSANVGRWQIKNCRIFGDVFPAVNMTCNGGSLDFNDCSIQVLAPSLVKAAVFTAGFITFEGGQVESAADIALDVSGSANIQANGTSFISRTAGVFAIQCAALISVLTNCRIGFPGALGGGLHILAGGAVTSSNSMYFSGAGGRYYQIDVGGALYQKNLSMEGGLGTVLVNGSIFTLPGTEDLTMDIHLLTAPEIAAKQFTLSRIAGPTPGAPSNISALWVGAAQYLGVDFTVQADGVTFAWNGLGMDALPLAVNDPVLVTYAGSPKA